MILLIAVVAAISAVLEVGALTLLVLFAKLTAEGKTVYVGNLGWLNQSVQIGVQQLILMGTGVVGLRLLLQLWGSWLEASVAAHYRADQRQRLFSVFLRASWEKKVDTNASDLQNLLTTNVDRSVALLGSLSSGVAALGNVFVLLLSALLLSPLFAVLLGAAATGLFLLLRPLTLWARRTSNLDADLNLQYSREVTEAVGLSREIEVFRVGERVLDRTNVTVDRTRTSNRAALLSHSLLAPLYQNLVLLLAFGALATVTLTGIVQVEVLGITVLLMLRMASYTQGLQSVYHHVVGKAVYLEQLVEAEARHRTDVAVDGTREIGPIVSLALRNVHFSYSTDTVILDDLSLEIRAGEMIGVVGPSGAGKSTLTRLLLGMHAPKSGDILVNGEPMGTLRRDLWHRRIAYVPQDPQLIAGTVAENVRFFRDDIGQERVEAAVKLASLHETVGATTDGYQTRLGDGVELSGGERQRLCIARALAGEPDLLILDEPTSALDAVSESAIQRTLGNLHGKVTTLIIAHRLSTLEFCDRILVLRGGKIEAFDSPERVAATNQFFRESQRLMQREVS
jgi:ATP-binding cassette subfamily B protein